MTYKPKFMLDGKEVEKITAFLFHAGGHEDPKPLAANVGKSFIGSYVLGMGFTFDDSNPDATSIEEMHRLIEKDPKNAERIFPYIGGEEVNSSPTHSHHRYAINFGEMTENEALQYPDLMAIVEEKVKGKRGKHSTAPWWQFERLRGELFKVIAPLERVLICSLHSEYLSLAFLPANSVFSHALAVFASDKFTNFGILQSRLHETWARFFGSSLETRFRYTPTDCFETFPFPTNWENNPQLEAIGKEYYEYRAQLMISNNQGLTTTYNRFHDPEEYDSAILKLRDLHNQMDCTVLNAYGWTDLQSTCEFLLDYEDEEETDPFDSAQGSKAERSRSHRQKKKPYRYRWADEIRDEVLARLLALNETCYQEEVLRGDRAEGKSKKAKGKTKSKQPAVNNPELPFA